MPVVVIVGLFPVKVVLERALVVPLDIAQADLVLLLQVVLLHETHLAWPLTAKKFVPPLRSQSLFDRVWLAGVLLLRGHLVLIQQVNWTRVVNLFPLLD